LNTNKNVEVSFKTCKNIIKHEKCHIILLRRSKSNN